jgi:hypothetical protein
MRKDTNAQRHKTSNGKDEMRGLLHYGSKNASSGENDGFRYVEIEASGCRGWWEPG